MDFTDYQYQERKSEAGRPLRALCMNTTWPGSHWQRMRQRLDHLLAHRPG